jgi:neuropeptide Y receptor
MMLMLLQYVVPLLVLVFTYTRIAIEVWGKKTPGEAENTRDQRMARNKRKVCHVRPCSRDCCILPLDGATQR